jgi:Family of unknown function (DUF6090)
MINIFRKVRKELASENKVMAYLRYAIGEILLVVVGILIALQVNNWNELRKNKSWERRFLTDITTELKSNLNELQDVYKIQKRKLDASFLILKLIQTKDSNNKSRIDSLFALTQSTNKTFFPTTGVYDAALSSGKIEDLENDELKYSIMNLYNHHFKRIVYNGEVLDGTKETVDWEKRNYFNIISQKINSWKNIIGPQFSGDVQYLMSQTQLYTNLVDNSSVKLDSLILSIEKYLSDD